MEPGLARFEELTELQLSQLEKSEKKAIHSLISRMPKSYSSLIDGNTSLFAIFKLSLALSEQGKLSKKSLQDAQDMLFMCASTRGSAIRQREIDYARKHVRKSPEERERDWQRRRQLTGKGTFTSKKKRRNRILPLAEFAQYAGNQTELRKLKAAREVADTFIEMQNPKEKRDFSEREARSLYEYCFPNPDEADPWENTQEGVRIMNHPKPSEKGEQDLFHVLLGLNKGNVVAYCQFSTLPFGEDSVIAFGQYQAVADRRFMQREYGRSENFRQEGIGGAFSAMTNGIAMEDAMKMGRSKIAGAIGECEMLGQAESEDDIRFTKARLLFHKKSGRRAIMLEMGDGSLMNLHMQPRLSSDSKPLMLHMLFRSSTYSEAESRHVEARDKEFARSIATAYLTHFERSGFDKKDVAEARKLLTERIEKSRRVLLVPMDQLPDMIELAKSDPALREQVERDYGSLESQEKKMEVALSQPTKLDAKRLGS